MSNPHDTEVNPETLWHNKLKFWPSAVLAELSLRIQSLLQQRAKTYRREVFRDKDHNPE